MTHPWLSRIAGAESFALVCRGDRVELRTGPALDELPECIDGEVVAALPYRTIAERGLACIDDGAPLLAFAVTRSASLPVEEVLELLPSAETRMTGDFDLDDHAYEKIVRAVVEEDIGGGTGSNFVIRRTYRATIADHGPETALAAYRRLLRAERGAYWTFLLHCRGRTLLGATPESQARLDSGIAAMNPISGTYRYPPGGPTGRGLRRFLADRKETEELYMVADEELKTMARICDGGGRLRGPWLRPMSRLAHTEYIIDGPTRLGPVAVLRATLPAPTVTGSPIAAACRTIADREDTGRGYYGGAIALLGPDTLDSALLIRTAEIGPDGSVTISVGSTLVRHCDPAAEAAETRAKAAALLAALKGEHAATAPPRLPALDRALARRNAGLSPFWLGAPVRVPPLAGRILIIDNEDDFTAMLARLVEAIGLQVDIGTDLPAGPDPRGGYDAIVLGPGPGDPRDRSDPRIDRLHAIARRLLAERTPTLAVCLGHQVLADEVGLAIRRLDRPAQGEPRHVPGFGRVGFYNTFAAVCETAPDDPRHRMNSIHVTTVSDRSSQPIGILRDARTGVVHAMRIGRARSIQFHVESVLTAHGPAILRRLLAEILVAPPGGPGAGPYPSGG
ncbi:chorismate-binding protein [Dactylosporangium vinaceum]|uniref:anthranilate synthase n=1 Tax=Dactylosporangium vinaceum TaxID=53362 RepID=A0ABV5LZX2_9ACTN|nr:anthranilate synthase family protein [Dactylosporangium vinaceum]UAB94347.1 chorismate-binding protein [Dactylosporangium vinaceum]